MPVASVLWNSDIVSNVLADTYVAAVLFAVFAMFALWLRFLRRRRVMRFLGITPHQSVVRAHVSYLDPSHFGSGPLEDAPETLEDVGGVPQNRFTGPFVTQDEIEALAALRALIEGKVREGPGSVSAALRRQTRVRRVQVQLRTEPPDERMTQSRDGLIILLGSGRFNARSRMLLESSASFFRFEYDTRRGWGYSRTFGVSPDRTGAHHDYVPENGRHPDPSLSCELATVQRIHDPTSGSTVLLCCGLSSPATHAAALYVSRHWASLAADFPDATRRDIGVLLRLPEQDKDAVLDPDGPVVVVRMVDGEPIPRSRVTTVVSPPVEESGPPERALPAEATTPDADDPPRGRPWNRRHSR